MDDTQTGPGIWNFGTLGNPNLGADPIRPMPLQRVYAVATPDGPKTFYGPGNAAAYLARLMEKGDIGAQFQVTIETEGSPDN